MTDTEVKELCEKEGYELIRIYTKRVNPKRTVRYIEVKHLLCGKQYETKLSKFVNEGQRCMCQRKMKYATYQNLDEYQKRVDSLYGPGEYNVVGPFISIRKPITVVHKCGYRYEIKSASWLAYDSEIGKSGLCPICHNRKHRTTHETEMRLKGLGFNFTIIDNDFNKGKKIVRNPLIHNNNCGCEYRIDLNAFLTNPLEHAQCPKCQKWGVSHYEDLLKQKIAEFYKGIVLSNYRIRDDKQSYELDIYIPEKNLGIEIDGLYWHSNEFKSKTYHLDKTRFFANRGIRVVHIFEDEIFNKFDIVIDKIHSMITKCDRQIYGRKCSIIIPTAKEKAEFLNMNHIQGDANTSNIVYGLKSGDELVAVMTFSKHRGRGKEADKYYGSDKVYELTRYATKIGTNVIGGFSKLLARFKQEYDYEKIISYGDIRYTDLRTNVYSTLGFREDHLIRPSYYYVKGIKRMFKYNYRKSKLKNMNGFIYDDSKTEQENMLANGYGIIYDCGLIAYVMDK